MVFGKIVSLTIGEGKDAIVIPGEHIVSMSFDLVPRWQGKPRIIGLGMPMAWWFRMLKEIPQG